MHSKNSNASPDIDAETDAVESIGHGDLCTYQLFCRETYFGEVEIFKTELRRASVRCEIPGETLVLHKYDLMHLANEYPQFGNLWRTNALRKECKRQRLLSRGLFASNVRHLAAKFIQTYHRSNTVVKEIGMDGSIWPEMKRSTFETLGQANVNDGDAIVNNSPVVRSDIDDLRTDMNSLRTEIRDVLRHLKVKGYAEGNSAAQVSDDIDVEL